MSELDKCKKLGFGLMRLPQNENGFDVPQIEKMVDEFISAGCTYFDTAWIYPGSEEVTRKVLVERYPREKFLLATKLAPWSKCKCREDALQQFYDSLSRTGAGYFDYYLLHNLGENRTRIFDDFKLWDFALEQKAKGLIRHLGFSFHSTADELEKILQDHPEMEFVQLQINYADWEDEKVQSRRCYEVARKYGKPVIVMEPVKGGLLAAPPENISSLMKAADPERSCASWAIRFAASLPGVMTVLSGMSTLEQMRDNLSFMADFREFDEKEKALVDRASVMLRSSKMIPCTACNYCAKECPENIGIAGTFDAMNMLYLYNNHPAAVNKEHWSVVVPGKARAAKCIGCGKCEKVCPQHIKIREFLAQAAKEFP
ncbi:MAG: aldo/keto reductase [Lentisphaeria bacterium]|nr:aldo/keto reductase [Lentisphaeria bacterium]